MTEFPIFEATPTGSGTFKFWCGHCRKFHEHGGLGHFVQHCWRPNAPYKHGYILVRAAEAV